MTRKLWAVATTAVMAVVAVAASASVEGPLSCPAEDVTFELVTGHVFRSPADILGRTGSFLLLQKNLHVFLEISIEISSFIIYTQSAIIDPEIWKKEVRKPFSGHENRRAASRGLHRRMPRERVLPLGQLRDRAVRHVRLFGRAQAG